jgi:cephalosporin hydroxylase
LRDRRIILGFAALGGALIVVLYLVFVLGGFDSLVRGRAADIAQLKNQEWVNNWFGVGLLQYPSDLMTYQQLVWEIRPDVIIETGTYSGGLTLYLSSLLEQIHPEGKVISVDLDTKPARDNFAGLGVHRKASLLDRIQLIEASSTDPTTIATIRKQVGRDTRVLIILDSLHTRENVLRELELYGPFVSKGSYVIVNDTHLGRWYPASGGENIPYGGAGLAVADFLAKSDEFEVDERRDRFLISCAPGGFLKRVR